MISLTDLSNSIISFCIDPYIIVLVTSLLDIDVSDTKASIFSLGLNDVYGSFPTGNIAFSTALLAELYTILSPTPTISKYSI